MWGNTPTFAHPPSSFRPCSGIVLKSHIVLGWFGTTLERGTRSERQERGPEGPEVTHRSTFLLNRSVLLPQTLWVVPTAFLSFPRTRTLCRSSSFWIETTLQREILSFFGRSTAKKSVMPLGMKRHRNDNETTLGWYWSDCKTMQECIVLNVLGPAILIQSRSALFLFLFQPKLSLFCRFLSVLFSFHSKMCIWVLFGESPGFSPRWGPLSLSPSQFVQLCWATLYSSDHQASRNLFSGPFRIPAQTFSFFSPHYISLCLRNQASKNVKCHRTVDCRDQTVTERPVRPRVSAPVICINTSLCIYVPHPCHFNKIDLLTY